MDLLKKKQEWCQTLVGKKVYRSELVFRRNFTLRYWARIFSKHSTSIMFNDSQIANGGYKIEPRIIFDKKNDDLRDY